MAQSIKLGNDTYLDASGVVMNDHTKLDVYLSSTAVQNFANLDAVKTYARSNGHYPICTNSDKSIFIITPYISANGRVGMLEISPYLNIKYHNYNSGSWSSTTIL